MSVVNLCDATGKPIPEGEGEIVGWGKRCVYSAEGLEAYEEYADSLKAAAAIARDTYDTLRLEALAKFLNDYPDGKLPDSPDEDDD